MSLVTTTLLHLQSVNKAQVFLALALAVPGLANPLLRVRLPLSFLVASNLTLPSANAQKHVAAHAIPKMTSTPPCNKATAITRMGPR